MNGYYGLNDAINQIAADYVNRLVGANRISGYVAQNLLAALRNQIPNIAQTIANNAAATGDPNNTNQRVVEMVVEQYANNIMAQMQTQMPPQPQQPMMPTAQWHNQPMMPNQAMTGFGMMPPQQQTAFMPLQNINPYNPYGGPTSGPANPFSSTNPTQPQPQPTAPRQPQQKVVPVTPVQRIPLANKPVDVSPARDTSDVPLLANSSLPVVQFSTKLDKNATKLSTSTENGPIVDVIERTNILDERHNEYVFSRCKLYILEPNVRRVINNFVSTNKKLTSGQWISHLNYKCFELRRVKCTPGVVIDLKPLLDVSDDGLTVDMAISQVIDNINDHYSGIVKVLDELITNKFNDYSKKLLRSENNIDKIIKVTDIDSIKTLPSMRDDYFGDIMFHPKYQSTLLMCFRLAVSEVITEHTKIGHYNASDIVTDLIADQNFVIRGNGYCEREMLVDDPRFIDAINAEYTAFANYGDIVVTNFIPEGLIGEITGYVLEIDAIRNIIDMLTLNAWKNFYPTIVMIDNNTELIVKIGKTLNGMPIMFRDSDI